MLDQLVWQLWPLACLLSVGAPIIIPGMFVLAHKLGKKHPRLGRTIALSWLSGILGLIPGLTYVTYHDYICFDICFENAPRTRGWPFTWQGYTFAGNLFVPLSILGNIVVVALIASVGLGFAARLEHRITHPIARSGLYSVLVLTCALFPLLGQPIMTGYETYIGKPAAIAQQARLEQEHEEYEVWIKESAKAAEQVIRLECGKDLLLPSSTTPGVLNIQVDIIAKVNEEHVYYLDATLRSGDDFVYGGWISDTLSAGEHHLQFTFPTTDSSGSTIHADGPYEVVAEVTTIEFAERSFSLPQMHHAKNSLGMSLDGLKIKCQTKPYQLIDLRAP